MRRCLLLGIALGLPGALAAGPGSGQGARPPAAAAPPAVNSRQPKDVQAAQLALQAEDLQRARKWAEAAAAYQRAAELTPDDWVLWDKTGWAHLDNGQAEPALNAFQSARKAAPAGAPAPGGLLIAHFALGQEKETLGLAQALSASDLQARAAAVVRQGLAAKPRTADWSYALGYLYTRVLGNSARALGPLEAVVQADPKHAGAWLLLVEVNAALNRGRQEDAAAVQYLELLPESVDAYRLRADRFTALQRYTEAAAEYQAGIVKYPASSELYFPLARVYERAGDAKQAEATYQKLVTAAAEAKNEPLRLQARAQLANFHARQRRYADAEKYYREAAARPDATAATWSTWGSLLALSGRWEEAAKTLEGAASREEKELPGTAGAPRDDLVPGRCRAAVCRLAAGQRDLAKAGLQAALALQGEGRTSAGMDAAAFLAWIEGGAARPVALGYQRSDERWAAFTWRRTPEVGELEVRGRFSPAATAWRAILQQVQKSAPTCWPADYALARIYAGAGFTAEALKLLDRVREARADWWAPHYAVGDHFARLRNKERGLPPLRRALELAPACRQARVYVSLLAGVKDKNEDGS